MDSVRTLPVLRKKVHGRYVNAAGGSKKNICCWGRDEKADHYPYIGYFYHYNYRGAFFRSVCNRECADMGCRFNQSCLCGGCGFFDLVFLSVSVLQKANPFFEAMDSVRTLPVLRKKIQGRYVKQVFPEKARKPAYRFSEKQECSIALRSTG